MSFLFGAQPDVPSTSQPLGVEPQRLPTSDGGKPVPVLYGRSMLSCTWLAPVLGQFALPVTTSAGKSTIVTGYNYWASFAGLICMGQVDHLWGIRADGEWIWTGHLERSITGVVTINIPLKGIIRLYWGTENQPSDPLLAAEHPNYFGQCYFVAENFLLGEGRTTVPAIEFDVSRFPTTALGPSSGFAFDTNPTHIVADMVTDSRYGLNLPPASLDVTTSQNSKNRVDSEGIRVGAVIQDQSSARELFAQVAEYIDGWVGMQEGLLALQLTREAPGVLKVLTESDLAEPPSLSPEGWDSVNTEVQVVFRNRRRDYEEDARIYYDAAAKAIMQGEVTRKNLQRPWVTDGSIAQRLAVEGGRLLCTPRMTGRLRVLRSTVLEVGEVIQLDYQDWGLSIVLRVIELTLQDDTSQDYEVEVEMDRWVDASVSDLVDEDDPPSPTPIAAQTMVNELVIELPRPLVAAPNFPSVGVIGGRANQLTVLHSLHRSADGASYELLSSHARFGVAAHLVGDVLRADSDVQIEFDGADTEIASTPWADATSGKMLVFVGDEIMSARDVQVISASQVWLRGLFRGFWDTVAQDHAPNTPLVVMPASAIQPVSEAVFVPGSQHHFKISTSTARQTLDLADATALGPLTIDQRALRPLGPSSAGPSTYTASSDITISWLPQVWDAPSNWWSLWPNYPGGGPISWPAHVIEILTTGEVLQRTINTAVDVDSVVYANADLVADFGSEPAQFLIRIWGSENGLRSRLHEQITVTKS